MRPARSATDYTQRVGIWHWLLLGMALAGTCASPPDGSSGASEAVPAPSCRAAGELNFADGTLSYQCDGRQQWSRSQEAVPYRIVCLGPPALVTTAGPDLAIATLAVGDEIHRYPDMYPQLVRPPLVVLNGLPVVEEQADRRTVLLAADGTASWSAQRAQLLWPAAEPKDADVAYFVVPDPAGVEAGTLELVYPWGQNPRLVAVAAGSGAERWRAPLKPSAPLADVELWGLSGEAGLLSMQYDYQVFEFAVFAQADGEQSSRQWLMGQPATQLVYPGEFSEPLGTAVGDSTVSLAVYTAEGNSERWTFDLDSGELAVAPFTPPARASREENELPPGGAGPPPGRRPPFKQALLPTQGGRAWSIPALVNSRGEVLVVSGEECLWFGAGGA